MPTIIGEQSVSLAEIIIIPELENFNIVRSDEEIRNLEGQIISEGKVIRDPLVVWPEDTVGLVLVDGFSRHRIAKRNQIDLVKVVFMQFSSYEEAKCWIQINQSARRNLTKEQQAFMVGKLYAGFAGSPSMAVEFVRAKGDAGLVSIFEGSADQVRTAQILGDHFKVSEKTVRRNYDYFLGIEKIRSGNSVLADELLSSNVIDNNSKPPKISRSAIESLGKSNMELPTGFNSLEEIFEKKKRKDVGRGISQPDLRKQFNSFLRNPSPTKLASLTNQMKTLLEMS